MDKKRCSILRASRKNQTQNNLECNLLPWRLVSQFAAGLAILFFLALYSYYQPALGDITSLGGVALKAVGLTTLALMAIVQWDLWRWLWKIRPDFFNRVFFPDLQGRYRGTLLSNYTEPAMCIENVELTIHQRLTKLIICMKTGESESITESAQIVVIDRKAGRYKLFYVYRNEPRNAVRPESMPHTGVAQLNIELGKKMRFHGRYFNDHLSRLTSGEMDFTRYGKS